MPRVVAGKWKGFPLEVQKGSKTRPTADRVKEAIFSIIQERIPDSRFLDCFAGSGQIGLEALSRGADFAVLIEKNRGAFTALCRNVEKTGCQEQVSLHLKDSVRHVKQLAKEGQKFDLIYFDPPWKEEAQFLESMAESLGSLLAEGGLLIVETDRETLLPPDPGSFQLLRTCHYGRVMVLFYSLENASDKDVLGKDESSASLDLPR